MSQPSIIHIAEISILKNRQRSYGSKTITNASSPHVHSSIACKHIRIIIYHIMFVLQYLLGYNLISISSKSRIGRRFHVLSKELNPKRTIALISPHTIIIISRSIIIPSFSSITVNKLIEPIHHFLLINLISLILQETLYKHIEKHPVGTNRRTFAVAKHC